MKVWNRLCVIIKQNNSLGNKTFTFVQINKVHLFFNTIHSHGLMNFPSEALDGQNLFHNAVGTCDVWSQTSDGTCKGLKLCDLGGFLVVVLFAVFLGTNNQLITESCGKWRVVLALTFVY